MIGALLALVLTQGVLLKSGDATRQATVSTTKSLLVVTGPSSARTYIAHMSATVGTSATTLTLEAPANTVMRATKLCVSPTSPTAAVAITVQLRRAIRANTGGTVCLPEASSGGTCYVAVMDSADPTFDGVARSGSSAPAVSPLLGSWGFIVGEHAAGAADYAAINSPCVDLGGLGGGRPPTSTGTQTGMFFSMSAAGVGAIASTALDVFFTLQSLPTGVP